MKKFKYLIATLLLFTMIFQSCSNFEEVETPNFNVEFNRTAKVGEPVEFTVANAPDFLNFFAGDFERKYINRNRTNADGVVTMSFLNSQKWGLGTNAQGTFSVWYSKDYDGSGEATSVNSATWVDISNRFNISTLYDFTFQNSGDVDITDLADGNPIYFGFKYFSDNTADRGAEWYFDDLNIKMEVEGAPAPLTVATENNPGFKPVDVQGIESAWNGAKWYFDTAKGVDGIWRMRGNSHKIVNEDWLITNPINLTKVAPDKGVPLKTYSEKLETFSHTYTKSGTYTITFVGNNTTVQGNEESIKEYTIEVE